MRLLALVVLIGGPAAAAAQGTAADYARAAGLRGRFADGVKNAAVDAHWAADGNAFWYDRRTTTGGTERVRIDAVAGTRGVIPVPEKAEPAAPAKPRPPREPRGGGNAFFKDNNVWARDPETKAETPLTRDGTADDGYGGRLFFSPDGTKVIAVRTKAGGTRKVTLVESSPKTQLQPKTKTLDYLKPGDDVPRPTPHLFDLAAKKEIPVSDALFPNPWDVSFEHWSPDSKRFYFVYNQRGHQVVRVVAIDADTGTATAVVNEECKTFFDYAHKLDLRYLDASGEFLWTSERSGWNHVYRVTAKTGAVKPVTAGEWVVRRIDRVDPNTGEIDLQVLGIHPGQDPYHTHFVRVSAGGKITKLTTADGTHAIAYSPDRRFYVDTYSRVDLPPVTALHRTDTGAKVCDLETADISGLTKAGWKPPQRFVAKGRDGVTDIHGVIFRPTNFDPEKTYPVIEEIYAGPQDFYTPKRFAAVHRPQAMAELGFIVVKLDGTGTNWRSKAFHDVCWKNLGDSGLPDRVKWIRAAAAAHKEMDLARGCGIYGGSAGGQNAVRAMTEFPDFYTVCVADCGCHDNRMDKVWWNELWMGYPVGPHYAAQSNVTNAHKLKGKLLLVVGELDTNVDPASTLQVANALIKADKDFELLLIPGAGHGAAEGPYGSRRRADFFVTHLLRATPRGKP